MNGNNDFLENLKVDLSKDDGPPTLSLRKDMYMCQKLIEDTSIVDDFLLNCRKQKGQIKGSKAIVYYYALNSILRYTVDKFINKQINGNEFSRQINEICTKHNIDFEYLTGILDKIRELREEPNYENSMRLSEEIEERAIEEVNRRIKEEGQKE